MSLQDWLKSGRLKAHKTGGREIAQLLALVDRDLADARINELSADRRFATAYNAALQIATAVLAASGFRASKEGHHYWTIQSLAFTMNLDGKTIEKLDKFRKKRNISDYEMTGMVSEQEVKEMLALAENLGASVLEWLQDNHPELVEE